MRVRCWESAPLPSPITHHRRIILSVVDTGVDRGVCHVDQQVDENEAYCHHQDRALDRGIVTSADRGDDVSAQTWAAEDGFREERSTDARPELAPDRGDDRD